MPKLCKECNRKILLVQELSNKCHCGEYLCNNHKYPEDHKCKLSKDYWVNRQKEKLTEEKDRKPKKYSAYTDPGSAY